MNRKEVILRHFSKYKYISSMQAFELYGITRLSAVIYDLRNDGHKIGFIWRTCVNRYGKQVRYADYFLIKKGKNDISRNNDGTRTGKLFFKNRKSNS